MGKKVKKVFGGGDDGSKALARQQAQLAQQAKDAQIDLRTTDELAVYEGASAQDVSTSNDAERRRRKNQGLSGALGLGGV